MSCRRREKMTNDKKKKGFGKSTGNKNPKKNDREQRRLRYSEERMVWIQFGP